MFEGQAPITGEVLTETEGVPTDAVHPFASVTVTVYTPPFGPPVVTGF